MDALPRVHCVMQVTVIQENEFWITQSSQRRKEEKTWRLCVFASLRETYKRFNFKEEGN